MTDFLGDDFLVNRTSSPNMLVAVKTLRRNADQVARLVFDQRLLVLYIVDTFCKVFSMRMCSRPILGRR